MEDNNSNLEKAPSKFISFKKRGDLWKDVEPVPQFTKNVEILKIDYSEKFREINDYFRAILHKNEISVRAYNLTTELIMVRNKIIFIFRLLLLIIWLGITEDYA